MIFVVNFKEIERKWQERWEKAKIFFANVNKSKPKFFITFPYPYVNGSPHIGHMFSAYRVDSYARFKRMRGFNVLFPQGFHATGEPILGAIKRLREGEKLQINTLKFFGATDEDIKEFCEKGPEFFARFWMKKWIENLKRAGFSIDWRRTFLTIDDTYKKFVEWQYKRLKKLGYVTQGTHPVIWCPSCKSPTGDHDRLKGEGETPIEFILIKFELNGKILPCATLRPETVFGVTNLWVNPSAEYVLAKVDEEEWIVAKECIIKLKEQLKRVEVVKEIKVEELIGKKVKNPVLNNYVLILPASFVDPNVGTGIVMSVPSHAPYDYAALKEIKEKPELLAKFRIDEEEIKRIKPISIIKVKGFGEHPAIEICERLGIKSQDEKDKLDEATEEIYKKEFHLGVLKENCGKYAGYKVSEIKEKLIEELKSSKIADSLWEPSGEVICRCKTRCFVKILENQWFIKYSDEKWKEKTKEWVRKMKFYPEVIREQFIKTIDWLKDKACTRKSGLGTRLPWDKEWIIEPLSDSTIYMAYYTIARIINEKRVDAEKLIPEVFDFVFLGEGSLEEVSRKSGIEKEVLKEMREEFEYFYPVDLRSSGKDLIQNHLTFFLFQHIAIWDNEKYWPRAIAANGFVQVRGEKMSKSKGNVIPLYKLLEQFGSDLTRINIIGSNENLDDADWREENIKPIVSRINFIFDLCEKLNNAKREEVNIIDKLLESKLNGIIKESTELYEELRFRSATQLLLFNATNFLKSYIEICGGIENCNKKLLRNFLEKLVLMLTPLLPHICEELWERLGKEGFIALADWPTHNEEKIRKDLEQIYEIFEETKNDIREILKLIEKQPAEIRIFIAKDWKFLVFEKIKEEKATLDKIFEILGRKDEEITKYYQRAIRKSKEMSFFDKRLMKNFFEIAKTYLENLFKCKVSIIDADESEHEKARLADIDKPGILIV